MKQHSYNQTILWTGNQGEGTKSYKSYSRNHTASAEGKADDILLSSDPSFRGDSSRYNPEELLVSSVSSCHMLWYLHFCSINNITVIKYEDHAEGTMIENKDGSGTFSQILLNPNIEILESEKTQEAMNLHEKAHRFCFIANSCNFPIHHKPTITVKP